MSDTFPIIRLEVERLRHSIMACLGPALDAEKNDISVLVENAVKNFDFQSLVVREAYSALTEGMREATRGAVRQAFLSDEIQAEFLRLAKEQVKGVLEQMTR